ncbi:MAG: hypothetical protein GC161_18170 [Planctomycetaceae bacterium]|nr:hypothetical protein [Planctomycetaceae bacterium]
MLKYAGVFTALAGAAFTLGPPALQDANEGPRVRALRQAASEREQAIYALGELHRMLDAGDSTAFAQVKGVTEPNELAPMEQDQRLEQLRLEVAELQLMLDAMRAGGPRVAGDGIPLVPRAGWTVGLSADELSILRPPASTTGDNRGPAGSAPTPARSGGTSAPPTSGSATAVPASTSTLTPKARQQQARTAFLAQQYEKSLSLLEGLPNDPDVLHLRSRSMERLGRLEDALGALRMAATDPRLATPEWTVLSQRIEADREYIDWMLRLRQARVAADQTALETPR